MSTTQPTYDEIMRLFKETDESFKETAERFKLSEGQLQEGRQELKEIRRIFWEMSDATDRKIKEVSASIGKLGNRLSDFIEDAVRPAAVRLFQGRGIAVHEVQQNVTLQRG